MRRLFAVGSALALTLVLAAPVAAQGAPERERWTEPEILFFGEEICGFEIMLEDTFANVNAFFFPVDRHGNERMMFSGGFRSTLTNLETHASIDITYFGRQVWWISADGTAEVTTSGGTLFWFTEQEAEVSEFGHGMWLLRGQGIERYDADGNLVHAGYRGKIVLDVCAALAG
jgi:hypothetical protein